MRVGVALNDSQVGLAAYILEKFSTWTSMSYKNLPACQHGRTVRQLNGILGHWFDDHFDAPVLGVRQ